MFDDPKKELQKLEDQLLAAEINHQTADLNDEEFEELYDKILEEFGPREENNGAPVSEPPIRNFANDYGKAAPARPLPDGDEILSDDEPAAPKKGVKGLVFLAVLEILAIAAVAAYWLMGMLG